MFLAINQSKIAKCNVLRNQSIVFFIETISRAH